MSPVFLGIDPGLSGAVAVLDSAGQLVALHDTPTVEVVKGDSRRHEPDVPGMTDVLRKVGAEHDVRLVVLEKVQPMPKTRGRGAAVSADAAGRDEGWGALPNFSLGTGYGLWWGVVVALRLPLDRVPPQTWRARVLAGRERGKEANRLAAIERWPAWQHALKLKKHHGRADASWLAEYGRRATGV